MRVTAGLLEMDDKLLIAQRKKGDNLEYKWELPGGKIEKNESPEECLRRELNEEFGIVVKVTEFFSSSEYNYEHGKILLLAYKVKHVSGEIKPLTHEKVEWVKVNDLTAYDFAEADKPLINKYLKQKHAI
ncbi:ADP-ribose pyrophosphatase [Thaumarchaeota archaeon SCGC AB-539-E09]|nr:ADP-ribose pyrophosphatase [Thaumarchaeota archaeon SCGC AB-539-E09]